MLFIFLYEKYIIYYTLYIAVLRFVIDTVRFFLPKCRLTTVKSRFSADELHIVRGEVEASPVLFPCENIMSRNYKMHVHIVLRYHKCILNVQHI